MNSPRKKGPGINVYAALLLMYTISVVEIGGVLLTRFTGIWTSRSEPKKRRLDEGNLHPLAEVFHDEMRSERRRHFIKWFDGTLASDPTDVISTNKFAALIVKENKVYCRKSQMKALSRSRYFVQMLQQGLKQQHESQPTFQEASSSTPKTGLPILIKHDDSNGCYPATHTDKYHFPRLTWSIPANATSDSRKNEPSSSWCSAIGMPSYKTWRGLNNSNNNHENIREGETVQMKTTTSSIQQLNSSSNNANKNYPWSTKIQKAIWRGSTTCNNGIYGQLPLEEIPRSKLVRASLDRPDLIDAGFHKVVGKYAKYNGNEGNDSRMLKDAIPLEDMMKYKAIIDIDGNNWSARFRALLCTNSVIIKIAPDFIEQYYHELQPNVHYISSTLDNLTHVLEDVLGHANDGKNNDARMRGIVKNANEWCMRSSKKESLADNAIDALELYRDKLREYVGDPDGLMEEWEGGSPLLDIIDDLVECNL